VVTRWLGAACVAWVCLGCGGSSSSTGGSPPRPVVVSEAARVSDADTRSALSAYDREAGTLRFSRSTALLAGLKLDDVLVSEPSAAAPSGFLRKVKSIRSEGSEVVLETTQASLTDVITQGDLSAETELGLDDLPDVKTLAPGITVHRAALGTIGAGDGYQFGLNFDQTILDIDEVSDDGDERVRAKVRIDGDIDFNAGYGVEIHIDPPNLNFLDDDFDLLPSLARFEASIGFSQRARLHVTGDADAQVTKEKKVAEVPFSPKCFLIGPIPVCIVPTIYVFVGTSGQVRLSFDYGATETAQAKIGARWTKSDGWQKIDPTPGYDSFVGQTFDVNGGMSVQAWAKVEGALKLYDVTGPTLGAKLGLSVDAQLKRNPFWTARATLEAYYGFIVDLPIVGRLSDGHDTLFSISKEVAHSDNKPAIEPRVLPVRQHLRRDGLLRPRPGGRGCFLHPHLRQGRSAPEHELHLCDRGAAPGDGRRARQRGRDEHRLVHGRRRQHAAGRLRERGDDDDAPDRPRLHLCERQRPELAGRLLRTHLVHPGSGHRRAPEPVCGCVPGQGHLQCEGDTTRDVARSRSPGCREPSSRLHCRGHRSTRESAADHRQDPLGDGGKPGRLRCPGDPGERPGVWPDLLLAAGDRSGRRDLHLHGRVLRLPEPRAENPADLRSEYDWRQLLPPTPDRDLALRCTGD